MRKCPMCQAPERQVKSGKPGTGSQGDKGQQCGSGYRPEPKANGEAQSVREKPSSCPWMG